MEDKRPLGNPLIIVEWVRIGFLCVFLFAIMLAQATHPFFFNPTYEVPLLLLLSVSFLLNLVFLLNIDWMEKVKNAMMFFFVVDVFLISALLYFSVSNVPVFVLMYLINVLLSGLVYGRHFAVAISVLTAVCFNVLVAVSPHFEGQSLLFTLIFNDLAFVTVALLAGFLSDQINFMDRELEDRERSVVALKHLNRLMIENIPSGLLAIDQKGHVLFANDPAQQIFGSEIVGRPLNEMVGFDFRERELDARFDLNVELTPGDPRVLSSTGKAFSDPERSIEGHVLMFEDLTTVRRIEQKMRQSEKLAAVGQLAAGIAHEIRNPLASISGSVELLKSMGVDETGERLMNIVVKETHRLSELIEEFLEYVRPDKPITDEVNLSNLAHEVIEIVRLNPNLPTGVELKSEIGQNIMILGDRNKLKQAIMNIVINAYQAMDESEKPVCSIEVSDDPVPTLKISDTGVGMESATKDRIFEPFLTTKTKGTGLGLAVTHKIFENHKATIEVDSTLGQGTTFTIAFKNRSTSNT